MGLRGRAGREGGDTRLRYLGLRARRGGPLRRGKGAWRARRGWRDEHGSGSTRVTPTQAPRPAPDISKKMRPKNGDKEGYVVLSRAAPRPTRSHGPWEGVRPRPGAGQSQHIFFFQSAHFQNSIRLLHKLPHSDRRRFSRNRENQDTDSNQTSYICPNLSYIQHEHHTRFQPSAPTDSTFGPTEQRPGQPANTL